MKSEKGLPLVWGAMGKMFIWMITTIMDNWVVVLIAAAIYALAGDFVIAFVRETYGWAQ